jgi:hypothetical protein
VTEARQVAVEPALHRDATVVANLLELYSHDLSAAFSLDLGTDGRFGYEGLAQYWSEPAHSLRPDSLSVGGHGAYLSSTA